MTSANDIVDGELEGPAIHGGALEAHPDDHTPHLRPRYHFTARETWLNDPNGLVTHHGVHHMFFQNNPHGREWGNMSWGHATSPDLLTWSEHPIAITGDEHEAIFSGSVVWDRQNTSGFGLDEHGEGPLVAIYTSAFLQHPVHGDEQAQSLAFSLDDGMTWAKHDGNPVLGRGSKNFRDPKVFWHEPTGRWVMVAVEAEDRQLLIHTSPNLLDWTLTSTFENAGAPKGIWECPDLVEIGVEGSDEKRWVLLVSIGSDGPAGGSGMQWMLGDFDGERFRVDDPNRVRWFDRGPDQYAAVSFSGSGDLTRVVGWMSNWTYARLSPTRPWASAMTLVRELRLVQRGDDWALRQIPVLPDGGRPCPSDDHGFVPDVDLLRVDATLGETCSVTLARAGDDGATALTVSRHGSTLTIDRAQGSVERVHDGFDHWEVPVPAGDVELTLIDDHGLVEIFLDGGLTTVCVQTFPVDAPLRVTASGAELTITGHGD